MVSSPGSELLRAAHALGLEGLAEGFVDRRYRPDGGLVARGEPAALLAQPEALAQALALSRGRRSDGGAGPGGGLAVQTLCLHSDSPGAAVIARAVRQGLETAGFEVRPCAPAERVSALPEIHVVGAAILAGQRVLLARRGAAMALPGKWEMPGGKVQAGEAPREALEREIREELGLTIEVLQPLGHGSTLIAGQRVLLEVFIARQVRRAGATDLQLREHAAADWFGAAELAGLDWSEADEPIVPRLVAALAAASG